MGKIRTNRRRSDNRTRSVAAPQGRTRRTKYARDIFTAIPYTCPKLGESDTDNSDSFCVNSNKQSIAISDGASRSFNPGAWARDLTSGFTQDNHTLSIENIEKIANSRDAAPSDQLSWNEEELMLNGSHATLLVIYSMKKRKKTVTFTVHSIGDSILVICDKLGHITSAYPHVSTEKFPITPSLVSNIAPYFRGKPETKTDLKISTSETMFLMTDAVARYVARNKESNIHQLFPFLRQKDEKHFLAWANEKRMSSEIEDDDLTLVEITF